MRQEIRFCRAPDGVRIAYATAGPAAGKRPPQQIEVHSLDGTLQLHLADDERLEVPVSRLFPPR